MVGEEATPMEFSTGGSNKHERRGRILSSEFF